MSGTEADNQTDNCEAKRGTPKLDKTHVGRADNHVTHGLEAWKAGRLPSKLPWSAHVRAQLNDFAAELGAELTRLQDRPPSLFEQLVLDSAVTFHGTWLLAGRWLAKESKSLPVGERVALLREMRTARLDRDRALKSLGLDRSPTAKRVGLDDLVAAFKADRPAGANLDGPTAP